jgi:alpha-1,3-rhamnosyl/mannosyltransferase
VRSRTPRLIRLARRVITPTQAVREEAIERFRLDERKVVSVPHAPSDALAPPPAEVAAALRRSLGLPARYLLAIGAGNERKNIPMLIQAWRGCLEGAPGLGLVVIGAGASAARDREDSRLLTIENASDAETAAALSGAEVFVYPSLYEGFGLPLVEAMRAEIPVLASTDAALREVANGAALHFDPDSPEELTGLIQRLMHDPAEAERLLAKGQARVAVLSWRSTALQTRAIYEQAIRGN